MRAWRAVLAGGMVLVLAACSASEREGNLRRAGSMTPGPDEFSVLPSKPLEAPADFTTLPTPTPGGRNLTDPNPLGDAVAALGGRPAALDGAGVPASDTALVSHISRAGVPQDIRASLRAEDDALRARRGSLQRLRILVQDKYNDIYRDQTLDSWAANNTYRRAGIPTPSSPPRR